MKVVFLIHNAYAIGGVVRATANLAAAFAERHEVEIVSVFRNADKPALPLDPRVQLVPLVDRRPGAGDEAHPLHAEPSRVFLALDGFAPGYTRLADERVGDFLRQTDAQVVVSTRPGLSAYLAACTDAPYLRVAQEHEGVRAARGRMRADVDAVYRELDAVVPLTEADARLHREHFGDTAVRITVIPNVVPAPSVTPPRQRAALVVAAGRLARTKRFDLIVDAFAQLLPDHPDWRLRIYGRGPDEARLRRLINERGLYNHVSLMGSRASLDTEWCKGAIAVGAAVRETFGMPLAEAMQCGLPVVSTDSPHGPREIIKDGVTGLLVPNGDAQALAGALRTLVEDRELRERMGAAGRLAVRRFAPHRIVARYERLFASLARTEPPAADCTVLRPGLLRIRLRPVGMLPADTALVLRRRARTADEVRLLRNGADGGWVFDVETDMTELPEGHWDLTADVPGRPPVPLTAGVVETAELLLRGGSGPAPLSWSIPYATVDGRLALRVWRRERHAEITDVAVEAGTVTVTGRLFGPDGATPVDRPTAVLRARRSTRAADLELPLEIRAPGPGRRDPCTFTLCFAAADLGSAGAGPHDDWDLWLVPRAEQDPVRAGRLLDDIVNRKSVDVYPHIEVTAADRGPVRVRPFFTPSNELSVNAVESIPAPAEQDSAG
ncbi:glycosyltransferase [Streptomyces sp. NPDC001404]|uniref:glycosyltransferase n=1 Tax=Streptomyces sp. NPDC001404 TaxID=3364571 RepID=UPI0036B994E9